MSDKLLIEIDMNNGELDDAIPALIFLANELVESGTVDLCSPVSWQERSGSAYQVKWRFSEGGDTGDQIPLDAELAFRLNDALKSIRRNIADSSSNAIDDLQSELESHLPRNGFRLLAEAA